VARVGVGGVPDAHHPRHLPHHIGRRARHLRQQSNFHIALMPLLSSLQLHTSGVLAISGGGSRQGITKTNRGIRWRHPRTLIRHSHHLPRRPCLDNTNQGSQRVTLKRLHLNGYISTVAPPRTRLKG
jgi:hypothetical protein